MAKAQRMVRQRASRRADLRVLPNSARADFFEQTVCGGKPALRIWNCPSATEVGPAPRGPTTRRAAPVRGVQRLGDPRTTASDRCSRRWPACPSASACAWLATRPSGIPTTSRTEGCRERARHRSGRRIPGRDAAPPSPRGVGRRRRRSRPASHAIRKSQHAVDGRRLQQTVRLHGERPRADGVGRDGVATDLRHSRFRRRLRSR